MFNLLHSSLLPAIQRGFSRRTWVEASTAVRDSAQPDFDLSDFDDSPPTVPGGYWHATSEPVGLNPAQAS